MSESRNDQLVRKLNAAERQGAEDSINLMVMRDAVADRDVKIAYLRAEIDRSGVIIEALRAQVALHKQQYVYALAEWERVGNAIMLCATGNEAPLSDSDVCGVIADLRAQLDAVTQILGGYPDSDLLSLARTVAAGYKRWEIGHDETVAALRAQVAELCAE